MNQLLVASNESVAKIMICGRSPVIVMVWWVNNWKRWLLTVDLNDLKQLQGQKYYSVDHYGRSGFFKSYFYLINYNYITTIYLCSFRCRAAELREKFRKYDVGRGGSLSLRDAQFVIQSELALSAPTAHALLNKFVRIQYDQFVEFFEKVEQK